jgi:hypothetical protein
MQASATHFGNTSFCVHLLRHFWQVLPACDKIGVAYLALRAQKAGASLISMALSTTKHDSLPHEFLGLMMPYLMNSLHFSRVGGSASHINRLSYTRHILALAEEDVTDTGLEESHHDTS